MPRRGTNDDNTGRKSVREGSRKERVKLIDPLLRLFTKYPVPTRARANRHAVSRRMTALCDARASMRPRLPVTYEAYLNHSYVNATAIR